MKLSSLIEDSGRNRLEKLTSRKLEEYIQMCYAHETDVAETKSNIMALFGMFDKSQYENISEDFPMIDNPMSTNSKFANKFPRETNFGGCGIVAKLLYYGIKKRFNVTPTIVFMGNGMDTEWDLNQQITEFINTEGWRHVGIMIPGFPDYVIDSSGVQKRSDLERYDGLYDFNTTCTIKTLSKLIETSNVWNPTFKRSNIPNLVKVIDEILDSMSSKKHESTISIGNTLKEISYTEFKKDEAFSPKQKINNAIIEANRQIRALQRMVTHATKFKTEMSVGNDQYWTKTNYAIGKITERLIDVAQKFKNLR